MKSFEEKIDDWVEMLNDKHLDMVERKIKEEKKSRKADFRKLFEMFERIYQLLYELKDEDRRLKKIISECEKAEDLVPLTGVEKREITKRVNEDLFPIMNWEVKE